MLTGATERDAVHDRARHEAARAGACRARRCPVDRASRCGKATARAAASLGLPFILSTASSTSIEDTAEANGEGPRWFQPYWPSDHDVCASILARANAAGFTTLVLTLDTWTLAWRPSDLDQAYLPFLQGEGCAVGFSDPVFCGLLEKTPE